MAPSAEELAECAEARRARPPCRGEPLRRLGEESMSTSGIEGDGRKRGVVNNQIAANPGKDSRALAPHPPGTRQMRRSGATCGWPLRHFFSALLFAFALIARYPRVPISELPPAALSAQYGYRKLLVSIIRAPSATLQSSAPGEPTGHCLFAKGGVIGLVSWQDAKLFAGPTGSELRGASRI